MPFSVVRWSEDYSAVIYSTKFLSSVFQRTRHIRACITPFASLNTLHFVNNNGSRIKERTDLVVFDGQGLDLTRLETEPEPVGRDVRGGSPI